VGYNTFDAEGAVAARKAILTPQLSAHLQQKAITAGECQVCHFYGGWIPPAACTARNNDWDVPFAAGRNQ
jgi:hypothetical protein